MPNRRQCSTANGKRGSRRQWPGMTGLMQGDVVTQIRSQSFTSIFAICLPAFWPRNILSASRSNRKGRRFHQRRGAGCDGPVAHVGPSFRYARGDDRHARAGGPRTQQSGDARIQSRRLDASAPLGVASRQDRCVRNAGVFCFRGRLPVTRQPRRVASTAMRLPCAASTGCHVDPRGAAGAANRPAFRTSLRGRRTKERPACLGPDKEQRR